MKAGIARHPAEREGRFFVCQRASGSWYAGLSAALDQGIVEETQLYYRQANKSRVKAEIPYNTISASPPQTYLPFSNAKLDRVKDEQIQFKST